eukprot:TRINITY_DN1229_c0_g3_i4.p1 TRINITY_DN1229_c0_g3~~TRINITY_DN1229_c0_g3_i4.p1  ORF type:complete len:320 (-),score=54.29 TRINITY_DN1229_c0_g3_i4:417-1376(-)
MKKTKVQKKTLCPVWNEELKFKNIIADTVDIKVMDKDSITADDFLGSCSIEVQQYLPAEDKDTKKSDEVIFVLDTKKKGPKTGKSTIKFKIVTSNVKRLHMSKTYSVNLEEDETNNWGLGIDWVRNWRITEVSSGQQAEQLGIREGEVIVAVDGEALSDNNRDSIKEKLMIGPACEMRLKKPPYLANFDLTLQSAHNIPKMDSILRGGKCDAYVKVTAQHHSKRSVTLSTSIIKNSLEPVWNECLNFTDIIVDPDRPVRIELFDQDKLSSERIGRTYLNIIEYYPKKIQECEVYNEEFVINPEKKKSEKVTIKYSLAIH